MHTRNKRIMRRVDDDVTLSKLPPETKLQLWENIKTRNPEKAACMLEALAAVREFFPNSELTLTKQDYEEYIQ